MSDQRRVHMTGPRHDISKVWCKDCAWRPDEGQAVTVEAGDHVRATGHMVTHAIVLMTTFRPAS